MWNAGREQGDSLLGRMWRRRRGRMGEVKLVWQGRKKMDRKGREQGNRQEAEAGADR